MASPSLEELLAEEGFRGRKSRRSSFKSEAVSMPLNLYEVQNQKGSASRGRIRTERTKSDVSGYKGTSEFLKTERVTSRKSRDNMIRSKEIVQGKTKNGKSEERDPEAVQVVERLHAKTSVDLPGDATVVHGRNQSDVEENERFKDIFSNEDEESERGRIKDSDKLGGKEKVKDKYSNIILRHFSFGNNSGKTLQQAETSDNRYNRKLETHKSFKVFQSKKHLDTEPPVPEPALDEVAIQAMVSILSGYIKRFLKDKEFQESLHCNCLACISSVKLEESHQTDVNVITNLEDAIEIVEGSAQETRNAKELKKASLQLSVITSLNSKDLKDGFTSGIHNSLLSACAHLYLSVIYKIQKKNKISAKHLLQVFCDSPSHARLSLLPELWDLVFLPHLSHLRVWYDQEVTSIPDTSSRPRKLKVLEKVYNEILDSGTYQFAVYYKNWLTEGAEAPSLPSITIPSMSVQQFPKESSFGHSPDLPRPIDPMSSQPMISKKLYDAVFVHSTKQEYTGESDEENEEENFENCTSGSDAMAEEDKRMVTYSLEQENPTYLPFQQDVSESTAADEPHHVDGLSPTAEEQCRLPFISASKERELKGKIENIHFCPTIQGSMHMLQVLPHKKANELILNKLAESVFPSPQAENSIDFSPAISASHLKETPPHDSRSNLIHTSPCVEGHYANDGWFDEESFFSNVPKDFICPLTGELFEEPVTLETGHSFERKAIKEWFDKRNRTCPTSGRRLESLALPVTNFVLKRVIDSWISEHCKNLFSIASKLAGYSFMHGCKSKDEQTIYVLEQLLNGFKAEERLMNAKHLVSLGGLQFLLRRFELGNLEEKTRVAALLSCCIKAVGGCRNNVVKNINKACLLKLLHRQHIKSRENAVMLLTELICLERRIEITLFLKSLQKGLMSTMHVLLVYLQSSPPNQRPLVAALLLHFDLLVLAEPRKYSIYREEAVDSITVALECGLNDEKIQEQCCQALLILGGQFSFSGDVLIESWLLRQAGFYDGCDKNYLDNAEVNYQVDETIQLEEDSAREDWWKNLAVSLIGNRKKSFLEIISKCLGSGNLRLIRTCLITVAWLSQALGLQLDAELQLSAFSILIPKLKETLESGKQIEDRVIACMTLLNFSQISECRVLMKTIAEEISIPLQSLAEITWTAKQLLATMSGEGL